MNVEVVDIWTDFQYELRAFILKRVKSEPDADDILQDVFVKIIQNQEKLTQAQNVKYYLYGMVRNAVYDFFRNQKSQPVFDELDHVFSEEESEDLYTTLAICCVKPFIGQLPEKYQAALNQVEMDGVSQKEFAEKNAISYSAAKSRVQRGREKLKELIVNCCAREKKQRGADAIAYNCDC